VPGVRAVAAVATAAIVGLVLAGCVAGEPAPVASPTSASATPSATPTERPVVAPSFLPGGTALANKAYFDYVNTGLLNDNPNAGGQAIIDNLIDAGFDVATMQVTPDKTAVMRIDADSIQFSVLTSDQCLIGQTSPRGYHSIIGPEVSEGICLSGKTRPIDWR